MNPFSRIPISIGLLVVGVSVVAAQPASFEGLDPQASFPNGSRATAIAADGRAIVGELLNPTPGVEVSTFRWFPGSVMENLGSMAGNGVIDYSATVPTDVNENGLIIVGYARSSGGLAPRAFIWDEIGSFQRLSTCAGATSPRATAITPDAARLVGYSDANLAAWSWNGLTLSCQPFQFPVYPNTGAIVVSDVSADGQVACGYVNQSLPQRQYAVRWFADRTFEEIDQDRAPVAISGDGAVIVEARERWTAATGWTVIPSTFPFSFAGREMQDVSGNGTRVVGFDAEFIGGPRVALIWDEGVGSRRLQDVLINDYGLDLNGWTLEVATAISDDGKTIVGYGLNPQGRVEAWRAVLGFLPESFGDVNCDGLVSVSDIAPFVLLLTDPVAYANQFPACDPLRGDFNNNGFVSVSDIGGFVETLTGN